ncbi:MAG: FKBP-type peptidyl-prolyl cis-trans isomerase [Prevotellaceae bacterium]|jgi:FKBP-type peptidyl-prolyl cis-trans isomerase|nr:FKBP-type peptidyl-prolyl cis-trans isomerase [Prevotellaceae bacterium]
MKKIFFIIAVFSVVFNANSCKSDEYEEWKIMNENWYSRQEAVYLNDSSYQKSSSGLIYKVLEPGYQRQPNDNSIVMVKYKATFIDGTAFRISGAVAITGDSVWFSQNTSTTGWREALKLIKDGGHIRFFMPYQIGYGKDGYSTIPPYSTLFFDVKLYQSLN